MTKRTRLVGAAAAAAVIAGTGILPASAEPDFTVPAGQACAFELGVEVLDAGNRHTKEFFDENGNVVRIIVAGKGQVLRYTNEGTGASVSIKTGGSVTKTVIDPDTGLQTVTATGGNGLILFPSDYPAGPTTTQYIGRIVYTIDPPTGVFTLVSTSGQSRDICAELS